MPFSWTAVQMLVWGPLLFFVLVTAPLVAAFLEAQLLGSTFVENIFRWLEIHDGLKRFRDWRAL